MKYYGEILRKITGSYEILRSITISHHRFKISDACIALFNISNENILCIFLLIHLYFYLLRDVNFKIFNCICSNEIALNSLNSCVKNYNSKSYAHVNIKYI